MRFGVLGPLAVWTDRGEPVAIPGRKVRALLADLLIHEGRSVSADRLVEDLWGDAAPADATAALHVRVSQLRRALAAAEPGGRELVVSQPPGYALRVGPDDVDAPRFARLVGEAQYGEALGLWRGPALADFSEEEFARLAVARWEEQRLSTVEAYAEARLALGEHRELVGELGEHVARHPYRERLRAAHMRALYRAGRAGEALDSFQELRRALADELGLDPSPELAKLHRAILAGDPAEDAPAPAPRPVVPTGNLPAPVTELIGREHAIARIRELLASGRLVTITGPGGVGKTSVALAVARAHPGGAWLIDLTTWDGSGDPAEFVLSALSIPDSPEPAGERLSSALRQRRMLLLLDNCEHVAEPVAGLVSELLAAAPGLRVLATSREPLRLRGEARWDLPPLAVPDTDDPERLAGSSAVRLFLARAGLAAESSTVAAVAEVCRRLDGIPLALELAATRVPALGVTELAARLRVPQDRFGLLGSGPRDAPARQRTLAAVIDWSWHLLTSQERAVLRRLAVHSGGCTLVAAETVGGSEAVVLDLVDRSLVVRTDGPRFRLLESVSAYCLDRLREAGEEGEVRRRHADYYLELAERADARLRGPEQREWLRVLDAEGANLRAALETFQREGAAERARRLAEALTWYWFLRGRLTEARRALASTGGAPAWAAGLAMRQGEAGPEIIEQVLRGGAGPEMVEQVLQGEAGPELVERVLPGRDDSRARWFLASASIDFGDASATGALLESALEEFRATGDRWGEAAALSTRAMLAHMRDDTAALESDARRSAELFGELGDDWGVLQATDWLIGHADMIGDHALAMRLSREGLRLAEEMGLWPEVAGRLAWLAWISVQIADYSPAFEYGMQAKRSAAEQGLRAVEVLATIGLAFAARRDGRLDPADDHLRWLLATARAQQSGAGHPPYLPMVLIEMGLLAAQRGDPAAALPLHLEGFDVYRDQRSLRGMAWALAGMADALVRDGRPGLAAQLLGVADTAWHKTGLQLSTSDTNELARITAAVETAEPGFADHFARGRELEPGVLIHELRSLD